MLPPVAATGEQQSAQAARDRVLQELDLRCRVLPPGQDIRRLAIHFMAVIVLNQDKAAMILIDSGLRSKCCNLINGCSRAGEQSRRRRATQPLRVERRPASHLGPMRSLVVCFPVIIIYRQGYDLEAAACAEVTLFTSSAAKYTVIKDCSFHYLPS